MSHTPNELTEVFSGKDDAIHTLRLSDPHFAKLADDYHSLNRQIHRAETNLEPTDDFTLENLRKQRLGLLDRISPYLR